MMDTNVRIRNKKATFQYELIEKFTAGIELYGTEIKSIRKGKASLVDAYCLFVKNELYVRMYIAEYEFGSYNNHATRRDRKLLLTKRELRKLEAKVKTTGIAIIPTVLFINKRGFAKLEIAVAKGKKAFDKREDLKSKDSKRDMDRMMKTIR